MVAWLAGAATQLAGYWFFAVMYRLFRLGTIGRQANSLPGRPGPG